MGDATDAAKLFLNDGHGGGSGGDGGGGGQYAPPDHGGSGVVSATIMGDGAPQGGLHHAQAAALAAQGAFTVSVADATTAVDGGFAPAGPHLTAGMASGDPEMDQGMMINQEHQHHMGQELGEDGQPAKKKKRRENSARHHCEKEGEVMHSSGKNCDDNNHKGWADTGGLKRHMLAHGEEKKKYHCGKYLKDGQTMCDFSTNHSATMYAHRKGGKHVDQRDFKFKCLHCTRQFPLRQGLDRHTKTHEQGGGGAGKTHQAPSGVQGAVSRVGDDAAMGGGGPMTAAVEGASAMTAHLMTPGGGGQQQPQAPQQVDANGAPMPPVIDPNALANASGPMLTNMMDAVAGGYQHG